MAKDAPRSDPGPKRAPAKPRQGPSRRELLLATLGAFLVACLLLLVAVLPAEYGIDPTGIGGLMGFSKLAPQPDSNETINQTTTYTYRITWPLAQTDLAGRTGYTREGTSTEVTVPVEMSNVTLFSATLTWDDANETAGQRTRPDLFQLQVKGPDGRAGDADLGRNGADGKGNVTAHLQWQEAPAPRSIRAQDDDEAANEAAAAVSEDRSSVGAWTILVSMLEAGDVDAQGSALSLPATDEGNTWSLALRVESFAFDTGQINESKQRHDRVRLQLDPGQGLEYKFDLEAGAALEYAWNTTGGALYYDFHGERRGDTSGAFTRHASGTSDGDEGELTAPFAGTHGWYWENRGDAVVFVELETSGVYTVIGRK